MKDILEMLDKMNDEQEEKFISFLRKMIENEGNPSPGDTSL